MRHYKRMPNTSRTITTLIVHAAYTPPSMDIGASTIRRWHTIENDWQDIGYHYVIRRNGEIETGRPIEQIGAHAQGHNDHSIGVCLVGGYNEQGQPDSNYTFRQLAALYSLGQQLKSQYPGINIIGHRDVSNKACPCFDATAFFAGDTAWQ